MGGNYSHSAGSNRDLTLSGPAECLYCRANSAESHPDSRLGTEEPQGPFAGPRGESDEESVAHLFQREPDS